MRTIREGYVREQLWIQRSFHGMVSMKPTIWDIIGLATAILSYQTSTLHSNTAVSQPLSQLKKPSAIVYICTNSLETPF